MMLQQPAPDDFVIATGEERSLEEFVAEAFNEVGLDWRQHVTSDPTLFRPSDIEHSCGNAAKAEAQLGWRAKHRFADIVRLLMAAEREGANSAA